MRYHVYMTEEDEQPLLEFIRGTGGRIVHIFSPVWPPVPLTSPPRTTGEDECLAIWYPDIIGEDELLHPDCQPERGPHGRFNAWDLPLVTFQRQWYWKRQATILAVELDYRAFRPNRPEEAEFAREEVADFEHRLARLCGLFFGNELLAYLAFRGEEWRSRAENFVNSTVEEADL